MVGRVRERYFLRIDGIDGESTDPDHPGEIDVASWSWGVTGSAGSPTGGGGAGKPDFAVFQVVAQISRASPLLVRSAATGRHHKTAVLTGARAPGRTKLAEFLRYELEDVTIVSVQHEDSTALPTERIGLRYARFEITVTHPPAPAVTFGFDLKKGSPT
jgi:type VI secretion system secreted protein Hcp